MKLNLNELHPQKIGQKFISIASITSFQSLWWSLGIIAMKLWFWNYSGTSVLELLWKYDSRNMNLAIPRHIHFIETLALVSFCLSSLLEPCEAVWSSLWLIQGFTLWLTLWLTLSLILSLWPTLCRTLSLTLSLTARDSGHAGDQRHSVNGTDFPCVCYSMEKVFLGCKDLR